MMSTIHAIRACLLMLLFSIPAFALADAHESGESADAEIPEPLNFVTEHRARVGGSTIEYTATAGTLEMLDDDEKPIAHFGYTSYVRKGGNQDERPVVFAYNGGPGSASMWLHMGILGPQRVVVEDLTFNTVGPFRRVNNEYSVIDVADLVMIDPIGTGFSRPVGEAEGEQFWGVDNDIESVSAFISRWTSENGRWASPKYLLGESYGGIRSGGVSLALLRRHNISLNGVILVSPGMDMATFDPWPGNDLPMVTYFTTYAATAWYHRAIEDRPDDLKGFLAEADAFAYGKLAPYLLKGNRGTDAERQDVLAGMERFTGVSAEYWDRANLRIGEQHFAKELLRDRRQVVGRIDSRFVGDGIDHNDSTLNYDPFFPSVGPGFVAAFNDYYRNALGVTTTREYVTSAGLYGSWDWSHQVPGSRTQPVANTAVDLELAMKQNPNMRVLVQQGYFDLAIPFGSVRHFIDHMDLPEHLRANLDLKMYEAGHMMYVHPESMPRFKADLAAFIEK
ncbi:S10 family peptidase [Congregibacter sp.]|uniref:S10 family peptidase n=1 Tax=Congregibacter sp. TaxID=2744308 RepID=UPI00385FA149